jgi:uncharacterized protein (TIGR02145 family)
MKRKTGTDICIISTIVLIVVNGCHKDPGNNEVPILTTSSITTISQNTATSGGIITFDGGSEVIARGVCWSLSQGPTIDDSKTEDGTGTGSFTSTMENLKFNTTYYVKAYAINNSGTGYGNELSFTTPDDSTGIIYGTVTDVEGNKYKTIVICTQTWMAENLRTTTFNDGSPIPVVTEVNDWANSITPALCWYGNDEATNKEAFGGLYNWYAINSGKLAPQDWRVATREDWMTLIYYLGGAEDAGGKMKETGFMHWESPNTGATNTSGFTALGGGGRYGFCSGFHDIMEKGYWWTATPSDTSDHAYYFFLDANLGTIEVADSLLQAKIFGFSVRCVKD